MIYLILIFLCGVSSHFIPQKPESFLKDYETVAKGLPVQNFDNLQKYLNRNCNLTIPSNVPEFSYATRNWDIISQYFCMGVQDAVDRLRKDYQSKKLKESLNEFFNQSSSIIMTDLRNISSDICTNFNNVVLENKGSLWMERFRSHFNKTELCELSCFIGKNITDDCVFVYGLHKKLNLLELKANVQTTTHVTSTDSHKSDINEVMIPPVNSVAQDELKSNKDLSAAQKSDGVDDNIPVQQQQTEKYSAGQSLQKEENVLTIPNYEKAGVIDPGQDQVGVEDRERFNVPTTTSTTAKSIVKGSSTSANQVNQSSPKQEVVPSKSEGEHKSGVGIVEDLKPPKPEAQDTDLNEEYQAQEEEDKDDDDIIEKNDFVEPKPEHHKKISTNEADFSKRIQSFGTKSVTAQEVDTEVSLMPWYLMVVFCAFLVYISLVNKKKIVAFVVEGRPSGRYSRRSGRPNTANYRKLDTNLEEAITSNCNTTTSHVIY